MAPTWRDYVDNVLISSGYASKAAIYGTEKLQQWATSKSFELQEDEIKTLVKSFVDPEVIIQKGLTLHGKKYTYINSDTVMMVGKCYRSGCIIAKCHKCVIIAVYEDPINAGSCLALVHKLADYFKEQGV